MSNRKYIAKVIVKDDYDEKMAKFKEAIDKLNDFANKITLAENIDAAKRLYREAVKLYASTVEYLEQTKGKRKSVAIGQLDALHKALNELEAALKNKYDSMHKELDLATELISLVTNSKNYRGESKSRIDMIIDRLNHDRSYKLLTESQLKDLKYTLSAIDPAIARRISDSVKDAMSIDVIKIVNRTMFDKRNESNYLGCKAYMRDKSRNEDEAIKDVTVILGFSVKPTDESHIKEIVEDLKEALLQVYAEIKSATYVTKDYPAREQYEIVISFVAVETLSSEDKLNARNETERMQQQTAAAAEAKKKLEEAEAEKQRKHLEQEMALQVARLAEKLAKAKTHSELEDIFDDVEELQDQKKISEKQFNKLLDIYNQADTRIDSGIADKDDSLFMKIKYENQIKKAETGIDIERIRKFIKQYFSEGRMNNQTYEYLFKLLKDKKQKLLSASTSDDSTNDVFVFDIKPKKGETEKDFIARFMKATKSEYPDEKQRLAVAYSYWRNR